MAELPKPLDTGKNRLPSPPGDQSEELPSIEDQPAQFAELDPSMDAAPSPVSNAGGAGDTDPSEPSDTQDAPDLSEITDRLDSIEDEIKGLGEKYKPAADSQLDEAGTGEAPGDDKTDLADIKATLERIVGLLEDRQEAKPAPAEPDAPKHEPSPQNESPAKPDAANHAPTPAAPTEPDATTPTEPKIDDEAPQGEPPDKGNPSPTADEEPPDASPTPEAKPAKAASTATDLSPVMEAIASITDEIKAQRDDFDKLSDKFDQLLSEIHNGNFAATTT